MATLLLGLALVGCASPEPSAEQLAAENELVDLSSRMLDSLIEEKARLLEVAYRLTTAASDRCGSLSRPRIGALVGSGESARYEWLREAAERDHGISNELEVIRLVPGGAFERAGVEEGDVLLSIGGETPRSLGELRQFLVTQQRDTFPVRIRRGERERQLTIQLDMACPVLFELASEAEMLVYERRPVVALVPRGLLRYAESDDRLAAALAHQLAHMLFDVEGQSDLEAERRADRNGAVLAARAGYDAAEAVAYWEDMARAYPWLVLPRPRESRGWSRGRARFNWNSLVQDHHDLARRMAGLREVVAAIETRRSASDGPER